MPINEKLKTHIKGIKKTQGEVKCAQKGIKNSPKKNQTHKGETENT
jgi:hypothetical protein